MIVGLVLGMLIGCGDDAGGDPSGDAGPRPGVDLGPVDLGPVDQGPGSPDLPGPAGPQGVMARLPDLA